MSNSKSNPTDPDRPLTHRDLLPPDLCPSLVMKQTLTHGLDEEVHDDRAQPGDGYYWCLHTCREVGPDDQLVEPKGCRAHRACYAGPRS